LTADFHLFICEKPAAVLFGGERVNVKTWREVYRIILKRCNQNEKYHENLIYLRNKVGGKCRTFLSDKPDGMVRPLKIDDDLYGETKYGTMTLLHILINRILAPAGFGCHNISIALKDKT
jgi:hypothetical protein